MAVTLAEVAEVYIGTFDRAPDTAGLEYWAKSGLTIEEIAESFFHQQETKLIYPDSFDNRELINEIYQNLFNRDAEEAGMNYWAEQLDSGAISRDDAIIAIIHGAQEQDKAILDNKTEVGLYFAAHGEDLSIKQAYGVMEDVDGTQKSVDAAKHQVDAWDGSDPVDPDPVDPDPVNPNPNPNPIDPIDRTAPTVEITDNAPDADAATGPVTYTFTFSEDVTEFIVNDVTVANGTKGTLNKTSSSVYTLEVTPDANFEGNMTVDVAADAAEDVAGNGNTAAVQNVQAVDTFAAAPTIGTIAGNDVVNDGEATKGFDITGTGVAGETITLTLSGGTTLAGGNTAVVNGSGNWSIAVVDADVTAMHEGKEVISATQTDVHGNESAPTTRDILVDTAADPAPRINHIATDDIINAAEAKAGFDITGTGSVGDIVNLTFDSGTTLARVGGNTTTVDANGDWSVAVIEADVTAMKEGAEVISVTETDGEGNESTAAVANITVDTVAPSVITGPYIADDWDKISLKVDEDSTAFIYKKDGSTPISITHLSENTLGDIIVVPQVGDVLLSEIIVEDLAGNKTTSTTVILGTNGPDPLVVVFNDATLLYGFNEEDILQGGSGDDQLRGGKEADTLTGGSGADKFVFGDGDSTKTSMDVITDFSFWPGDKIEFGGDAGSSDNYMEVNGGFSNLTSFLSSADTAFDGTVLYYVEYNVGNSGDGYIAYDSNGNGAYDADADAVVMLEDVSAGQHIGESAII